MLRTFRQDGTVNPEKLHVQHWTQLPDPPNEAYTVPASSVGAPLMFTGPQEGPVELAQMTISATSTALLLVGAQHRRQHLLNNSIHVRTVFGGATVGASGMVSYYLPETLWLLPNETLSIQFQDLSAAPNTVRVALHGRLWARGLESLGARAAAAGGRAAQIANRSSLPYWYTLATTPLVLGASATSRQTIAIDSDGAFELSKIAHQSTGAFTLRFWDPTTGRALTSGPVHSDLISGTADFPYILFEPLLMRRSSRWAVEITDLTAAPNTIYLTFAGRKIFAGDERL